MPRDPLNVWVRLDRLHCYEEGDGWGSAEPYLWTVFFKIDGTTVSLTEAFTLVGTATVVPTPGSHGNLGDTDVDAGDDVAVPEVIGGWQTVLQPIPVAESIRPVLQSLKGWDDWPGYVGVVCVLMEEDNVSDAGAEAGHGALNGGIQNALDQIVATRGIGNQTVTDAEIDSFIDSIKSAVSDAVKAEQSGWENFWSWLNADDTIGTGVFFWSHDDLAPGTTTPFSKRWREEGDWELFGSVAASGLCTIDLISLLFGGEEMTRASKRGPRPSRRGTEFDYRTMREFRDREFRRHPGLQRWWSLAVRHAPQLAATIGRDPSLLLPAVEAVRGAQQSIQHLDAEIPKDTLAAAATVLEALAAGNDRRTRIAASRGLSMLAHIAGRTAGEVLELLARIPPARHPRIANGPRISAKLFRSRGMPARPTAPPHDGARDDA